MIDIVHYKIGRILLLVVLGVLLIPMSFAQSFSKRAFTYDWSQASTRDAQELIEPGSDQTLEKKKRNLMDSDKLMVDAMLKQVKQSASEAIMSANNVINEGKIREEVVALIVEQEQLQAFRASLLGQLLNQEALEQPNAISSTMSEASTALSLIQQQTASSTLLSQNPIAQRDALLIRQQQLQQAQQAQQATRVARSQSLASRQTSTQNATVNRSVRDRIPASPPPSSGGGSVNTPRQPSSPPPILPVVSAAATSHQTADMENISIPVIAPVETSNSGVTKE